MPGAFGCGIEDAEQARRFGADAPMVFDDELAGGVMRVRVASQRRQAFDYRGFGARRGTGIAPQCQAQTGGPEALGGGQPPAQIALLPCPNRIGHAEITVDCPGGAAHVAFVEGFAHTAQVAMRVAKQLIRHGGGLPMAECRQYALQLAGDIVQKEPPFVERRMPRPRGDGQRIGRGKRHGHSSFTRSRYVRMNLAIFGSMT